jgi:zinc transport system substrate-binding protein
MIDFMKSENQTVVYYEELIDPKIARIIASESGAKLVMLHAAHNVSKDELNSQITYIEIMRENLRKLEEGLK